MYPTNALLHDIILTPIFVALAAPAMSSPYDTEVVVIRQSDDSFNEADSLEKRQVWIWLSFRESSNGRAGGTFEDRSFRLSRSGLQ